MTTAEALALLGSNPLRHIVTLKMLSAYRASMKLRFAEDASGWALVSELPLGEFPYDAATYGSEGFVVLVDGTSDTAKLGLLRGLPREFLVVKTYDALVQRYARETLRAKHVATFLSFTTTNPFEEDRSVIRSMVLTAEASQLFASNGYTDRELSHAFESGACWFGLQRGGHLASACFVFQNFDRVWEIGGVATEPLFRRQRLAATVVRSAVNPRRDRGFRRRSRFAERTHGLQRGAPHDTGWQRAITGAASGLKGITGMQAKVWAVSEAHCLGSGSGSAAAPTRA